MIKPISLLCLPLLAVACTDPDPPAVVEPHYDDVEYADPTEELYAVTNLPRFDLELSEDALDDLAREPREYTQGTFSYRGQVLAGIGVRLKGEASFRDMDDKPGFKLKFDKFNDGLRFRGLKRMTLNNNVQDPSFLSQPLAFAVYREAGLPAPRANSALVYVNGEYYGVYSNVETEDKVFLARWFDSNKGNLYEEGGEDFVPGAEGEFDLETNEDDNDRSDLTALVNAIDRSTTDDFLEVVGKQLDMEHYLTYVVVEALIGGSDGYSYGTGSRNNFRVYRDPTSDKFVLIPWGLDRGLRPRTDPKVVHGWVEPMNIYQSAFDARGILLEKCLVSPACRRAFIDRAHEVSTLFEQLDVRSQARQLFSLIDDAAYADPRKEEDNEYCDYAVGLFHRYVSGRAEALRAEL